MPFLIESDPLARVLNAGRTSIAKDISPLVSGAKSTSGWIPVGVFAAVGGTCIADQVGILRLRFSHDQLHIDYEREITIAASDISESAIDQLVVGDYLQIEFENTSAGDQSEFRCFLAGRKVGL